MNIKEALKYGCLKLKETEQPKESAQFLLRHVTGKDLGFFLAYPEIKLTSKEEKKYKNWLKKRLKNMPVWYITGYENFMGLNIKVNKNVLIPRPETEILVQKVLSSIKKRGDAGGLKGKGLVIVDVGTGSGAIGIAIAKKLPKSKVYLLDVSRSALRVAKKNIKINQIENIQIYHGNLLEPLTRKADVIVANLPYIPSGNMNSLSFDIIHHEPTIALEGGTDGLDLYRDFLKMAPKKLKKEGRIFLEIGEKQGPIMLKLAKKSFPGAKISFEKDWSGLDRFVFINLKNISSWKAK